MFHNDDWESLANEDTDIYSKTVTYHILQLSSECILNKYANIHPSETPWMHNELRTLMIKRKRAYDKAMRTKLTHHWNKYKKLRNDTTSPLESSKNHTLKTLLINLSPIIISPQSLVENFKTIISTNDKPPIPPLKLNNKQLFRACL